MLRPLFLYSSLVISLTGSLLNGKDIPECQEMYRAFYSLPNDQSIITYGTYLTDWECQGGNGVCHYIKLDGMFYACDEPGTPSPVEY